MVVQYNKIDKKVIKRVTVQLRKVTASLLGAVLNAADFRDKSGYYYYYHYQSQAGPKAAAAGGAGVGPQPVASRKS